MSTNQNKVFLTCANVQHNLSIEVSRVVKYSFLIGWGSDEVLHHVLLLAQISVELEVLAGTGVLGSLTEIKYFWFKYFSLRCQNLCHLKTLELLSSRILTTESEKLLESFKKFQEVKSLHLSTQNTYNTWSEEKVRRRVSVDSLKMIPFLPTLANSEFVVTTNSFSSDSSLMVIIIPVVVLINN